MPSTLCRDCTEVTVGPNTKACPACGSARLISHEELTTLSIAHVDCDAFFAAVEKRDDPSLADSPVIVGGGQRGVVATCCYIARAYGIRSAMPMFKALALCPQAVVVKPRFEAYREAAHHIRAAMDRLTPLVQPLSIDEAYLDLTGTERLHGHPPAAVLAALANDIEEGVGITISVGLSHNKLLAKIASDLDKPRGFAVIGEAEAEGFLAPHPPSFLPGVGPAFGKKLTGDGFTTLGHLQRAAPRDLMNRYGEWGLRLHALSRGIDARPIRPERDTKSVSGETTFSEDIRAREALEEKLYAMAQKVARRAKEKQLCGRVVTLKLKTADFRSFTRRVTLAHHTNLGTVIFDEGRKLLHAEVPTPKSHEPYRLIGIGISDLAPQEVMGADFLFPEAHRRLEARETAIDALRAKFGDTAVGTFRDMTMIRRD